VTPFLDQNLSMTRSGETYWYSQDGLGSVRTLTDAAGAAVNRYDYLAFGAKFGPSTSVTVLQRHTYTRRDQNPASSLMYYRYRQYDPRVGRFRGRDRLPDDALGPFRSLYAYAKNAPVQMVDPSGLNALRSYLRRSQGVLNRLLAVGTCCGESEMDRFRQNYCARVAKAFPCRLQAGDYGYHPWQLLKRGRRRSARDEILNWADALSLLADLSIAGAGGANILASANEMGELLFLVSDPASAAPHFTQLGKSLAWLGIVASAAHLPFSAARAIETGEVGGLSQDVSNIGGGVLQIALAGTSMAPLVGGVILGAHLLRFGIELWAASAAAAEERRIDQELCNKYRPLAMQSMRRLMADADGLAAQHRPLVGEMLRSALGCER
jgi:RHS repeat-associated protein